MLAAPKKQRQWNCYVPVASRAGVSFAPFASYLHSSRGGVRAGPRGQAWYLVVLASQEAGV